MIPRESGRPKGVTDAHARKMIDRGRILVDPATGVILVDGKPAGTTDKRTGYNRISVKGVQMQAHRVVYIFVHGSIPEGHVINHRDGNRRNNRIENLEAVTNRQNILHGFKSPNYRGTRPEDRPVLVASTSSDWPPPVGRLLD